MGIANIINNSTTTSGGEIVRELVNSSDGAGLHFDGASSYISLANNAAADFGLSDFSIEFILNQTQASTDETYYFLAPYTGDNRMGLWYDKDNSTLKIFFRKTSNAHYPFDYDMANDFGTPTHYVVTADRNGLATLYKNGNSVASVDISASSDADIGNTNPTYISNNSTSTALIGSIYRFRTWNKALTSAEVQTAFERADVDFADQYGSQTTINSGTTTNGKRYRITARDGVDFTTVGAADNNVGTEFLATGSVTLDGNDTVVQIGAVVDMDLAFASPTQSLTVQDRSGAADGTASASGVTQVQPVVQVNSEELRVAGSAPKIGVGLANTVTPAGKLHVHGSDGDGYLRLSTDTTGATATDGARIGYNGSDLRIQNFENSKVQFFTNNTTEALTILSSGVATFGNAMAFGGSNSIEVSGVTEGRINIDNNSTDTRHVAMFYNPNGNVGKITTNGLATSYSTSSDYRLKENLEPLTGALDRLDALPVYRFNFKADPDTTVDGFVAHEVSAHVPEAITGEKDAMQTVEIPAVLDDDGNEVEAARTEEQPDYQGIDQSKLVPLLVAAVKELKAKVEALENA